MTERVTCSACGIVRDPVQARDCPVCWLRLASVPESERGTLKACTKAGCMRYAALVALVALAVAFWGNYPRSYEVSRVLDGDTLQLSDGRTVRLHGIDAPESGQSYGREATAALKPVEGHRVKVRAVETDRYGRLVAKLYYEGEDIGLLMIRAGWAWHYAKYDASREYARAEAEAQRERRGLWAEDSPTAPWDWRLKHNI